jgi:hypothetical protein
MQFGPFLAAAAVAAQAAPPPERQAIVVTAPPPPAERDAREFVQGIMERSYDQVARYHAPVCAAVVGLEPSAARVVRDRILETARGVGGAFHRIRAAPPTCCWWSPTMGVPSSTTCAATCRRG